MEEKILEALNKMNQKIEKMDQKFEKKFDEMDQKIEAMDQKFEKKFDEMDQKIEAMDQKFEKKFDEMDQKIEAMDQKFEKKFDEVHQEIKEIRNQQFLFEQEYGTKIDAIFDLVSLDSDKNLEKSKKIRTLEGRMERSEVTIFGHEKRICKLELNQ